MKRPDKASDRINRGAGFFGIYNNFAEAFPSIDSVEVVVKINGRGARNILGDERRSNASTITEFVDCLDPQCYDGGFQVSAVLKMMADNRETHKEDWTMCKGHVGGHPLAACITQFNYRIDIIYR
jgi:hypothetical protein